MEKILRAYRSHCQGLGEKSPTELSIEDRRKRSRSLLEELLVAMAFATLDAMAFATVPFFPLME